LPIGPSKSWKVASRPDLDCAVVKSSEATFLLTLSSGSTSSAELNAVTASAYFFASTLAWANANSTAPSPGCSLASASSAGSPWALAAASAVSTLGSTWIAELAARAAAALAIADDEAASARSWTGASSETARAISTMSTTKMPSNASAAPSKIAKPGTPLKAWPMGGGNELRRASTNRMAPSRSGARCSRLSTLRRGGKGLCRATLLALLGPIGSSPLSYGATPSCGGRTNVSLSDSSANDGGADGPLSGSQLGREPKSSRGEPPGWVSKRVSGGVAVRTSSSMAATTSLAW